MKLAVPVLLRTVVRAESGISVVRAVTDAVSSSRSVALARVWLRAEGGLFEVVSSGGTPSGGGTYSRIDGEFREMAISNPAIARIADARDPFVVRGVRGDEDWLTNAAWAARQGVRSFLAFPLVARDVVVGVLAVFDREMPNEDVLADLALVTDIVAYRLADFSDAAAREVLTRQDTPPAPAPAAVLTRAELRHLERENIQAALANSGGKVFGANGAAALLGMRPTTLASRIKALGIGKA